MLKKVFQAMCHGFRSLDVDSHSAARHIENILFQLAYSWTHDVLQARQLARSVMQEYEKEKPGGNGQYRLDLYTSLFRRWCLYTESQLKNNSQQVITGFLQEEALSEAIFLQRCVSQLPKIQRVVISFVDIAELSYGDVSDIVNVEEKKIRAWITAARLSILQQVSLRTC